MRNQAEATLYVSGIFCTNCSALLQGLLSNLKGVFGVSIDLVKEVIHVSFNPDAIPAIDLERAVISKGYEITKMDVLVY